MRKLSRKNSVSWLFLSSVHAEAMISDITDPSSWKIFGCENGLRLFKEAKHRDSHGGHWDDHPAIMAVGAVDGTSETIFLAIMSLGPSRSEWDFCLYQGSVVECLDDHTDIIHKKFYSDWLPWGMKRRDLLLQRCWRREEDGTYVILYHSVVHEKCPPQSGYVRAHLISNIYFRYSCASMLMSSVDKSFFSILLSAQELSLCFCLVSDVVLCFEHFVLRKSIGGGFVITPVNQGQQSTVKHMLAIDWKFWKFYVQPSAARSLTISMLKRVAALRELFKGKQGNCPSKCLSREWLRHLHLPRTEKKDNSIDTENAEKIEEDDLIDNEVEKPAHVQVTLMGLHEEPHEFYDAPEAYEITDDDHLESEWHTESSSKLCAPNLNHQKLTSAAGFVRKLHDLTSEEVAKEDTLLYCYGNSLRKDPTCTLPCSWSAGSLSWFVIRGKSYLQDKQKIKANGTLMQIVGADWIISNKREDDLGSRLGGIVQKHAAQGGSEFFFIINFQIPTTSRHTLAVYYMMKAPVEDHPLVYKFVNGDDAFRNSRLKIIPCISEGSWIAKQSVRKRPTILAQFLQTRYFRGNNYIEVDIDIGSSTLARGISDFLLGYLNNLVVELAFIIQGNTEEELPEAVIGTCRLNNMDPSKALPASP